MQVKFIIRSYQLFGSRERTSISQFQMDYCQPCETHHILYIFQFVKAWN